MMSLHAENLEKRRDRLDQLREDLETRHQDLLQTQIAINEAWAQMAHVTGDEGAKDRVEQAREQLADYIRNLRDGLNQQRRELDEARAQFESQKETFRGEKQQLTDWGRQSRVTSATPRRTVTNTVHTDRNPGNGLAAVTRHLAAGTS